MAHSIICKFCGNKIEYLSSMIGNTVHCEHCKNAVVLTVPGEIEKPNEYSFPKKVIIQIVDKDNKNIELSNIAVSLKRGFTVGPLFTDKMGTVTITDKEYEEFKVDHIGTDLMGTKYRNYEQIEMVNARILSMNEVNRMIEARETSWHVLFTNESKRWASIEDLILALKNCNNRKVEPCEKSISLQNFKNDDVMNVFLQTKLNG